MIHGINEAIAWIKDNDCHVVVIESTGKYWIPVFNLMEDHFSLTLANPNFTKTYPGNKTDRRDAQWLAELHRLGIVPPSFIPPRPIRELRDLTRYRHKLVKARTSEKSRIHNILTVCNIMLSSVATDIFGKSGLNIIHLLLKNKPLHEDDLSDLVYGKLKVKIPDLLKALKGQLTETQAEKLVIALDNYESFNQKIDRVEKLIRQKSEPYRQQIDLLCSCFAIKRTAAAVIISEIGSDMSQFPSASHLCSWAGLCPENNVTGGKRRTAKTKQGNNYLKSILVQCVNSITRSKEKSHFVSRLNSIKMRRGHNKAVIAVCRSVLISIYYMLLRNEPYKNFKPQAAAHKAVNRSALSDEFLIEELSRRGYKLDLKP